MEDIDFNALDLARALCSRDFSGACHAADRIKYGLGRGEMPDRDSLLLLITTVQETMKRLTPALRPPSSVPPVRITDPRPEA